MVEQVVSSGEMRRMRAYGFKICNLSRKAATAARLRGARERLRAGTVWRRRGRDAVAAALGLDQVKLH